MDLHLSRLLRVVVDLGMVLIGLGAVLGVARDGRFPDATVPVGRVGGGVLDGDSAAVLTLGILVLLAGPGCAVLYLALGFAHQRDWRFAAIALAVALLLVVSVPVGLLLRDS